MKANLQNVLAFSFFSLSIATAVASPVQNEALTKRQGVPGVGQAFLCTSSSQCATVQVPYNYSAVCFDFSGNLAFLNDQFKTVTLSDMACTAYADNGCSGTVLGSDYALPGYKTIDFSNFKGHDYSSTIGSLKCQLL